VLGGKTLDEMRKRKMMRWRKIVMKELGFFPKPTRFIYNQTFMGLLKLKGPSTSMGFYIQPQAEDKTAARAKTQRIKIQYE
jgi:hypothetical protein